ncbi:MAG TPA: hypothetical protein VGB79_14315 [Allosphingosinicella sp.]|jgi:hypothetical protein
MRRRPAIAAGAILCCAALASGPAASSIVTTRAEFVGCPTDGQVGFSPAPSAGPRPLLPHAGRLVLAYYGSHDLRVLAPRGWHCIGLQGSNGLRLIVTPEPRTAAEFRNGTGILAGPAVEISHAYGGTSGRSEVAAAVARYFPAYRRYVRRVERMQLGEGPFATAPWPRDRVERAGATRINFVTPAGAPGEGTHWLFAPGSEITGTMLLLPGDEPDLITVRVRLPAEQARSAWFIAGESAVLAQQGR